MAKSDESRCWVGFDLGGTKMLAVVFDENLKPLGRRRKKTKAFEGVKSGVNRIADTVKQALDSAGMKVERLGGIGVGCPGPIDLERGVLIETPNLGWENVALRDILQEMFGCPATVVNDVDAGVYGEYRCGAAREARCVVGAFPGTGIGGGCVYDGRILSGAGLSCFEIGHIQVLPDGPLCGCGQRGCLEALASRLAISAAAAAAAYRGQAPHLLKAVGTNLADVRSGALADSIAAGDSVVEEIVRQGARWLGVGLATAVNLLGPDVVLLGGGLAEALPKLFAEEVDRTIREHVMKSFRKSFKTVVAELGDDAAATGAAAWVQETVCVAKRPKKGD